MILGVTGSIASGKSQVCRYLSEQGAPWLSADQIARDVVAIGTPLLAQLVATFGPEILHTDGSLDRETLGKLVFCQPQKRAQLNQLIHPQIASRAEEQLQQLRDQQIPLAIYEAPLLYECNAQSRVDAVLVVAINSDIQLQRLMARDQLSKKQALERIAAQMPQEEKLKRADYRIDNSGTLAELYRAVVQLRSELLSPTGPH